MTFTKEQIDMLLLFENGGYVTDFTREQWSVYNYLDSLKLLSPRYDIEEHLVYLSEKGKAALAEYRKELELLEKEARKEAEDKEQQAFQNKVSIANILVPLGTFIFGLLLEHFTNIIGGFSVIFEFIYNILH